MFFAVSTHKYIIDYFADQEFRNSIQTGAGYSKTIEKAHGQIETSEYFHPEDISWLSDKVRFKGLKTIGMAVNTIEKDGVKNVLNRYYISSLPVDISLFSSSVRGIIGCQ